MTLSDDRRQSLANETLNMLLFNGGRPDDGAMLTLTEAATVLQTALELAREQAREKLRLIDLESKQLSMFVGKGPRQRRTDRGAEEQSVVDYLTSQAVDSPQGLGLQVIAAEVKLGARTLPTLERLKKRGVILSRGRGAGALWRLAQFPGTSPSPTNGKAASAQQPAAGGVS